MILSHRVRKGIRIGPPAGVRNRKNSPKIIIKNPRSSIKPESPPNPKSFIMKFNILISGTFPEIWFLLPRPPSCRLFSIIDLKIFYSCAIPKGFFTPLDFTDLVGWLAWWVSSYFHSIFPSFSSTCEGL